MFEKTIGGLAINFLVLLHSQGRYTEVMEAVSTTPASCSRKEPEQTSSSAAVTGIILEDAFGDVVDRSPRFKLNVSIKAPVVYVPRNIHSQEEFLSNFGSVSYRLPYLPLSFTLMKLLNFTSIQCTYRSGYDVPLTLVEPSRGP